jgi:glyoxylase-like metal-dependent hydrolase (beta-lactamase superfamily II)
LNNPTKLARNLYLIDDYDISLPERTGTYVLTEKKLTIIETAASPSIPILLNGLKALNLSPLDVEYIIVTHIHLDHAGGVGLLLQHCPNAKVIVHPKGARHLADPSRLIAGAKAVYGDKFSALFEPILPVKEEQLMTKNHLDNLVIGPDCTLDFLHTPGHANHHFSIFYPKENGMFVGDTVGIYYPQLHRDGVEFYLPTTSPNQFDPEQMLNSILQFENMKLNSIYFGHFGRSNSPNEVYRQVRYWIHEFVNTAKQVCAENKEGTQQVNQISNQLMKKVSEHLFGRGVQKDHPVFTILALDIEVSAMGLADYCRRYFHSSM